jgi:flavin reductase (DIM6/NTAB) family NADH-FMN oxidoreductase RutF
MEAIIMKVNHIRYNELAPEVFKQLEKGAFLTTKTNNQVNTMTIAWGGLAFVWHKPVFIAYVRYSRETFNGMEGNDAFTVNIPVNQDLKKALAYCGTKSGRDTDKIKDCDLTLREGQTVNVPIIADCNTHIECNIIYKQALEPGMIPDFIKEKYYTTNDFHVVYYGEIVDSYQIEGVK